MKSITEVKVLLQPRGDVQVQRLAPVQHDGTEILSAPVQQAPSLPLVLEGWHWLWHSSSQEVVVLKCVGSFGLNVYSPAAKAPPKLLENRECFSGSCSLFNQGQRNFLVCAFKYSPLWLIFSLLANIQSFGFWEAGILLRFSTAWIRTKFLIASPVGHESCLIFTRCVLGFPVNQEVGVAAEWGNSLNVLFSPSFRESTLSQFLEH